MAREAGWAEVGGKLIRDQDGNAVDRTHWVPRAEWYQRMQQDEGARTTGGQKAVERAVAFALRGWRLTTQERRTVTWMLHEIEGVFAQGDDDPDYRAFQESIGA
jgi:hypothetical protein